MSWVRLDDRFAQHPKLLELSRADRWTWVEVLCYCARYETNGRIPGGIRAVVPAATGKAIRAFLAAGLLDGREDGIYVHDWELYNPPRDPTGAVRQARFRNAHRNEKSNGERNGEGNGGSNASRVGERARPVPVPQPIPQDLDVDEGSTVAVNPARENGNTNEHEPETDEFERRRALHDLDQRLLRDMP